MKDPAERPMRVAVPRVSVARTRAFRRRGRDRLWGAIGILVLLLAAAALFGLKTPVEPARGFNVSWKETFQSAGNQSRTLTESEAATDTAAEPVFTFEFPIPGPNVTRVLVTVNFTDDVGTGPSHGDVVNITVLGPGGVERSAQGIATVGQPKTLALEIGVNAVPTVNELATEDVAGAAKELSNQTRTEGAGTWRITARLVQAAGWRYTQQDPGQPCNVALERANACVLDRETPVTVRVDYFSYAYSLARKS